MIQRILAVTRPGWRKALQTAFPGQNAHAQIIHQSAADAVVSLSSNPSDYHALVLDAEAGGPWLDTLLDLTLGDTESTIRLLMLGNEMDGSQEAAHSQAAHRTGGRLANATTLNWPFNPLSLTAALAKAAAEAKAAGPGSLPPSLAVVDSIGVRYQPLVRFFDMRATKVEVLARVIDKSGALIGPEVLVNAMNDAENTMALTASIMNVALAERDAGDFASLSLDFVFNLPLDLLLHPQLLQFIETVLLVSNIPPHAICFELTETHPVTNLPELARAMEALAQAGYRLALDDITPDTPNLEELVKLPFRAFKIDRGVVAGAQHHDPAIFIPNRDFIARIAALHIRHKRSIVAEGIESKAAFTLMQGLGVTHGQGYYFARPLPAGALKPWLSHWQASNPAHDPDANLAASPAGTPAGAPVGRLVSLA